MTDFRKNEIVTCSCGQCMGPQQILKVDKSGTEPRYKVAYYNAIFGGRHWVSAKTLTSYS